MASSNLVKNIMVTAELMGTSFSEEGAKVFAADLEGFDENKVLEALRRCRQEVHGRLALSDVFQRIDFGHVGPEEAWALCPRSEADTVVWTEEICQAYFTAAFPLLEAGDKVAARMAFVETYKRLINEARLRRRAALWFPSLGHDKGGREEVINRARDLGRLPKPEAIPLLENQRLLLGGSS